MFSERETQTHLHTPQYKTQPAEEGWEKDNKHHLFLKEMGLKEERNFFCGWCWLHKSRGFSKTGPRIKVAKRLAWQIRGKPNFNLILLHQSAHWAQVNLAPQCNSHTNLLIDILILRYVNQFRTLLYSLPYLIFVIFFTRAKFLVNKIYTEKHHFFALNL